MGKKIKVLLAKLGLDVHDRGIIFVTMALRDAGMEVIYIGNASSEQSIKSAIEEDAEVIGVSSLGGAHLKLGLKLMQEAKGKGLKDKRLFLIGGVFPPQDIPRLKEMGFHQVFGPGTTLEEIVSFIEAALAKRFI